MRNELTNIERIERYLRNELSPAEHAAFESELKTNSTLAEEVRLQKDILKGIESIALKSMAKKAYKKYTLGKGFKKWGLIGGGTLLVFAASYFAINYFNSSSLDNKPEVTYELPELNENGEKVWADADKYLPYQKFTLNAQQDTVIETQDGIVMAVPSNCFLGPDGKPVQGEITLEVKEAIEANDILKAGLNTKSGDKLLETGGMFYVNARQNDKSLTIDPAKGVYTQIPTDEIKPGMQLFEGKRMGDGTIDWVAPKPMEKFLVPVDISSLNFYPPNYEDTLASLKGKKDKVYKDSLYYSYARLFDLSTSPDTTKIYPEDSTSKIDRSRLVCEAHYVKLNKKQIDAKLKYFDSLFPYDKYNVTSFGIYSDSEEDLPIYSINFTVYEIENIGINPARIKSIWDSKFNKTLIATKEFEERLQFIHTTCREDLLNIYVNNLDKKMCTLDSMAYTASGLQQFMDFASRADGRVKNGEKHLEKLRKYYEEKTKLYTAAVAKTEKEFWDKNKKEVEKIIEAKGKLEKADIKRIAENFKEEKELNMNEAYRQLGKPRPTYTVYVASTGWKNIDAYVNHATITRTTLDYTDPQTGKKAVIKYEELTASVSDYKSYDRVFAYLIPDQLSSYMRMEGKDGVFKEKLNEFIGYQLVVVGYKGQDPYYNIVGEVKKGNYPNIVLTKTESSKLDRELAKIKGSGGKKQSLVDELAVHYLENKEVARQKKVRDMVQFRERIQKVIFPCSGLLK